jgi:Flp pilus assembly pilin Flp
VTAFIKGLFAGEEGATMVEYALLVALIGAALVVTVTALSGNIGAKFTSVGNTISAAS